MKGRRYYAWKESIRKALVDQYGSQREFVREHYTEGIDEQRLSKILSPTKNVNIETIERVCEKLGLEIAIKQKRVA